MKTLALLTALGAVLAWSALIPLGSLRLRAAPGPSLALLAVGVFGVIGGALTAMIPDVGPWLSSALWMAGRIPDDAVVLASTSVRLVVGLAATAPPWLLLLLGAWGLVRGAPTPAPPKRSSAAR
jgi:hypothetical protein